MKSRFRAASLVFAYVVCVAAPLRAQSNAPTLIPIQGQLNDDAGNPLEGTHTLRFELYTTPTPEPDALVYKETLADVDVDRGFFTAYLGDGEEEGDSFSLSLFRDNKDIYLGIAVDDDELGEPLLQIGTSGYAAFAQHCATAATVQGMSGADLQQRVTGSCSNGAISQIGEDGEVNCQPFHDEDTRVGAGQGLQGGTEDQQLEMSIDPTYTQRRVTGTCSGNQFIQEVDQEGDVSCGSPAQPSLDCVDVESDPPQPVSPDGGYNEFSSPACPSGYQVVGGGARTGSTNGTIVKSHRDGSSNRWSCGFRNTSSTNLDAYCSARCCRLQ